MALEISPDKVTLTGKQSTHFQVLVDGTPVAVPADGWKLSGKGTLTAGVYTTPGATLIGGRAVVTATTGAGSVSAEVELSPAHTWIGLLWVYLVLVVVGCGGSTYLLWPTSTQVAPVVAGPALVTLKQGDSESFAASAGMRWEGLTDSRYEAKGGAGTSRVFRGESAAAGTSDATTVAVVESQDVSLKVTPGYAVVRPGNKVTFIARMEGPAQAAAGAAAGGGAATGGGATAGSGAAGAALTWDKQGEGELKNGEYTAPTAVTEPRVVLVGVHAAKPGYGAAARVLLLPAGVELAAPAPGWLLILMAGLCGAMGASLHGINSLAAYVGARQFLSSWAVYYLARPFVGGLLGPMMFLVFRTRLVGDAQNVNTGDWYSVAALAAISGLFADKAMLKLKQVVDVLFSVPGDERPHKLETGPAENPAQAPAITKLDPSSVAKGSPGTAVKITGTNFAKTAKVKVNGAERGATFKSATEMEVALTASDLAAAGEVKIQVVMGSAASNEHAVRVT